MEKVAVGDNGVAVGPKTLPKTGEERPFFLQRIRCTITRHSYYALLIEEESEG